MISVIAFGEGERGARILWRSRLQFQMYRESVYIWIFFILRFPLYRHSLKEMERNPGARSAPGEYWNVFEDAKEIQKRNEIARREKQESFCEGTKEVYTPVRC